MEVRCNLGVCVCVEPILKCHHGGQIEGQQRSRRNEQTSVFPLISLLLSSVRADNTSAFCAWAGVSPPLFFLALLFFLSLCWCIYLSPGAWQGAITLSSCSLPFLSSGFFFCFFLHRALFSLTSYCRPLFSSVSLLSPSPPCSLPPVLFPLCSLCLMGPDLPLWPLRAAVTLVHSTA